MPKQRPTAGHLFKSNTSLISSPGSTVTGAHARAELRATAQDNFVFLIIFFCLISKHNNTLQDSFSTLFDFSVQLWISFFFFFCVVLCFFPLLFTWATGTKILFNTLFIARNFWWRLFRRPSLQISQRGVLAVFLFGVGTVGGSVCAGGNKSTLRPQLQAPWPVWQLELWVVFLMMINIKKNTWIHEKRLVKHVCVMVLGVMFDTHPPL